MKICKICKKKFKSNGSQKCCSKKCSKKNIDNWERDRRQKPERKRWQQEYDRKRYLKNRIKILKQVKIYRQNNKDKIRQTRNKNQHTRL